MRGELMDLSENLLDAIRSRDSSVLSEILAEDFRHFDSAGTAIDKSAFIAGVLKAQYQIRSLSFEVIETAQVDEMAVVMGIQRAEVQMPDGSVVNSRGGFTDVFSRARGSWELRLAHSVDES